MTHTKSTRTSMFCRWRLITYIYPLFLESIVNVKWCNSYLVTARMNFMITIMLCLCVQLLVPSN